MESWMVWGRRDSQPRLQLWSDGVGSRTGGIGGSTGTAKRPSLTSLGPTDFGRIRNLDRLGWGRVLWWEVGGHREGRTLASQSHL